MLGEFFALTPGSGAEVTEMSHLQPRRSRRRKRNASNIQAPATFQPSLVESIFNDLLDDEPIWGGLVTSPNVSQHLLPLLSRLYDGAKVHASNGTSALNHNVGQMGPETHH